MGMNLNWTKCSGQQWCGLLRVNLNSVHFNGLEGVYIIWHGAPNPAVVRVGQGVIRDRLMAHRQDAAILQYQSQDLYVTWAAVPAAYRDGVERYLADKWNPKVGDAFPNATPTVVNSPW